MKLTDIKHNKKILLLGYGVEGRATHEFLKKYHKSAKVDIADESITKDYLSLQGEYDLVIRTPSLELEKITQKHTTATNIFFANFPGITIGITGTKGKSTTTDLAYRILKKHTSNVFMGGNIGVPLLDLLTNEQVTSESIVVAELSSYQLVDSNYSPHISVILNIDEAHLNFHGTYPNYIEAKLHICKYASKEDYLVYNQSIPGVEKYDTNAIKVPFGPPHFSVPGIHKDSISAVGEIMKLMKVDETSIRSVFDTFKSLPHRQNHIGTFDGISYIDDSASTVPSSTVYALESLGDIDTLIVGGLNRNHTFARLAEKIIESRLRNLVIFPNVQDELITALGKHSIQLNILKTDSMEEAVRFASEHTEKGKRCLLSPGFPSYNMFANFSDRGETYSRMVRQYAQAST